VCVFVSFRSELDGNQCVIVYIVYNHHHISDISLFNVVSKATVNTIIQDIRVKVIIVNLLSCVINVTQR